MKTDPEAGEQTTEPMPQLSDTVGAGYSTTDESEQPSRAAPVWSMSAGQTMAGAWVSLTVTVNEHIAELPDGSVAVQVTVVVPTAKNEPEAGVQVPAGTLEAEEDPWHAVLREAQEETGLDALQIVSYLGPHESTFENEQGAPITVRRHFFHLQFHGQAPARWQHWEMTPSGGVEGPILFELWWASIAEAGVLLQKWFSPFLSELSVL